MGRNWNTHNEYLDSLISGSHTPRHEPQGVYYKAGLPSTVKYSDFKTFDWNKDEIRDNADVYYNVGRSGFLVCLVDLVGMLVGLGACYPDGYVLV